MALPGFMAPNPNFPPSSFFLFFPPAPQPTAMERKNVLTGCLEAVLDHLPRGSSRLVRPAIQDSSALMQCSVGGFAAAATVPAMPRGRGRLDMSVGKKKKGFDVPKVDHAGGPPAALLMAKRPVALLTFMPVEAALFIAGAISGALAKTATAPLDRLKVLLQVGTQLSSIGNTALSAQLAAKGDMVGAFVALGKEEGIMGYWKVRRRGGGRRGDQGIA